ncbi:hypothetical protein EJB05_20573, partial [Eragrostis curvula]
MAKPATTNLLAMAVVALLSVTLHLQAQSVMEGSALVQDPSRPEHVAVNATNLNTAHIQKLVNNSITEVGTFNDRSTKLLEPSWSRRPPRDHLGSICSAAFLQNHTHKNRISNPMQQRKHDEETEERAYLRSAEPNCAAEPMPNSPRCSASNLFRSAYAGIAATTAAASAAETATRHLGCGCGCGASEALDALPLRAERSGAAWQETRRRRRGERPTKGLGRAMTAAARGEVDAGVMADSGLRREWWSRRGGRRRR